MAAPVIRHSCDEPLCQDPGHLVAGTDSENRVEWILRRNDIGSPLRDTRGRRGRAMAIRLAALTGGSIADAMAGGLPRSDVEHPPLPGLEVVSVLMSGSIRSLETPTTMEEDEHGIG